MPQSRTSKLEFVEGNHTHRGDFGKPVILLIRLLRNPRPPRA